MTTGGVPASLDEADFGSIFVPADIDSLSVIGKTPVRCHTSRQVDLRDGPVSGACSYE